MQISAIYILQCIPGSMECLGLLKEMMHIISHIFYANTVIAWESVPEILRSIRNYLKNMTDFKVALYGSGTIKVYLKKMKTVILFIAMVVIMVILQITVIFVWMDCFLLTEKFLQVLRIISRS